MEYHEEVQGVIEFRLYGKSECHRIVNCLRNLEGWTAAQVRGAQGNGGVQGSTRPDIRSAKVLSPWQAAPLYRRFEEKLDTEVKPLVRGIWKIDLEVHSGTHILRYGPEDHYISHQDTGAGFEERYFSVVCYLNDDFVGGRTVFSGLGYAAQPEAGKAILFPSHYLHGSEPIIRNEKFVFVSWICGPVPIRWI
jgi:hypothetical protein